MPTMIELRHDKSLNLLPFAPLEEATELQECPGPTHSILEGPQFDPTLVAQELVQQLVDVAFFEASAGDSHDIFHIDGGSN